MSAKTRALGDRNPPSVPRCLRARVSPDVHERSDAAAERPDVLPTDELLADERRAFALRHPREPTTAKQERRCHFDQGEQRACTPGSARGAGAEESFDVRDDLVVLDLELDALEQHLGG